MRGRNTRNSTMVQGRQYAVELAGTVITFECERAKHRYKIDFAKRPLARRMYEGGCKLMFRWWSRAGGGCIGECPKCERAARAAAKETDHG